MAPRGGNPCRQVLLEGRRRGKGRISVARGRGLIPKGPNTCKSAWNLIKRKGGKALGSPISLGMRSGGKADGRKTWIKRFRAQRGDR